MSDKQNIILDHFRDGKKKSGKSIVKEDLQGRRFPDILTNMSRPEKSKKVRWGY